jgi:hypothetical protein
MGWYWYAIIALALFNTGFVSGVVWCGVYRTKTPQPSSRLLGREGEVEYPERRDIPASGLFS